LEDFGVGGRIILIWFFKIVWDGIDWSDVTQEREKWPAVVNTVMNIRLTKNAGIFLTA